MKKLIIATMVIVGLSGTASADKQDDRFKEVCQIMDKELEKYAEKIIVSRPLVEQYYRMIGIAEGMLKVADTNKNEYDRGKIKDSGNLAQKTCSIAIILYPDFIKEYGNNLKFAEAYKASMYLIIEKK